MNVVRIYLKFGIRNLLPSDTLWGNLLFAIKRIYGEKYFKDLLDKFLEGNPPFLVSSCFPFSSQDGKITYFFPLPITGSTTTPDVEESQMVSNPDEMIYFKKFKKIKFIEKDYFEKIISSELTIPDLFKLYLEMITTNNESDKFRFIEPPPKTFTLHNTIDRWYAKTVESEEGGALFWDEEYIFASKSMGLFFLVDGDIEPLLPALRFLSDVGIAGNNTIGKGKFSFEIDEFNFKTLQKSDSTILLSLYSPSETDFNEIKNLGQNLYYELKIRSGFSGVDFDITPQQKNAVIVFSEGSVFFTEKKLTGRLIKCGEINSDYIIYNYYYGFSIPSFFKVKK